MLRSLFPVDSKYTGSRDLKPHSSIVTCNKIISLDPEFGPDEQATHGVRRMNCSCVNDTRDIGVMKVPKRQYTQHVANVATEGLDTAMTLEKLLSASPKTAGRSSQATIELPCLELVELCVRILGRYSAGSSAEYRGASNSGTTSIVTTVIAKSEAFI